MVTIKRENALKFVLTLSSDRLLQPFHYAFLFVRTTNTGILWTTYALQTVLLLTTETLWETGPALFSVFKVVITLSIYLLKELVPG